MRSHSSHDIRVRHFVTVLFVCFFVTGSFVSFVHVAVGPVAAHDGTHDTLLGTGSLGATDPADFTVETTVDGLVQPISLTFLPDGRMLVLEKGGRIVITDPADASLDSQTYMTLTNIDTTGERGLVSIVLDPQFLQNGYFYLYYQPATPAQSRVARFQHVENSGGLSSRGDLSSEVVVWENPDTYVGEYHFGGGFGFGPDGLLYLTTGEEFDPALSQDLSKAGGKIHRFYPNGTVPADNPFVDDASAIDTIWAYGLRNPYRAKWDLPTHRFLVGDVGGNVADSREEVNLGAGGANYGWPVCEGDCADSAYTDPLYSYPHRDVGGSIIGGPVYRGNQYPSEYTGAYFFAEYAYNEIRYLTFDDAGAVTGDYLFRNFAGRPVDLVAGPDGALYSPLIAYGNVKRVEYKFASDSPYVTGVGANVTRGDAPLAVEFTGFAEDPNGEALTYTWEFGDGNTATGATATHTYTSTGVYQARLRVTDTSGNEDVSDPIEITVGSGPTIQIDEPVAGSTFVAGDTIAYSGSATTAGGDPIPPEDLSWTVVFTHNDHTHPVLGPVSGSGGSFDIARTGHDYHGDTGYRISLTATDTSTGVSSTQSVDVKPEKVNLTVESSPQGIDISIDGIPDTTPYLYDTLIGFDHTLTAPVSQCVAGTTYEFDSWSDGGARNHVVRVPTTDTTYTATYVANGSCTASGVPTDGLVARYESTQGLSATGGTVTGWADASGNGNDLTAVGDPQVVLDAPNGQSVVAFDGSGDALVRTGLTGFPTGDADRTVVALVRYDSPGYGGVGYGSPALNQLFGLSVNPDGELMVQGWGRSNDFHTTTVGTGAGWLTQSVVHANGAFTHYKDGVSIDSASHTYATTNDRIVVGAEMTPAPYLDMDVAAVVVYDRALTDTERQQVEDYLRRRYVG
jgi:glucose/arabinose dehydrogenase